MTEATLLLKILILLCTNQRDTYLEKARDVFYCSSTSSTITTGFITGSVEDLKKLSDICAERENTCYDNYNICVDPKKSNVEK